MKKRCLALTALLLLVAMLAACGALPIPTDAPAAETPAAPAEQELTSPDDGFRPLTAAELAELDASRRPEETGFFVTTFDRPEEIDWASVCYGGAGISQALTDEQRAEYEQREGEIFTDVIAISEDALAAFAEEKTGVPYRMAREPIWDWTRLEDGLLCCQHGDTNAEQIAFTSGDTDGDVTRLTYTRSDPQHYRAERPFVMTARIRDGKWQYLSNVPADAPAPIPLVRIDYTETLPDGEFADTYEVELTEYDEPGTVWAVVTAETDDVRLTLERVEYSEEFDVLYPQRSLKTWTPDAGEKIAVCVNQPWHPTVRLAAAKGDHRGSYIFGEDNWLHFDLDVPRYITGHDLDGEGVGASPTNEAELVCFLTDGSWVCFDGSTGTPVGAATFTDDRELWLGEYVFRVEYAHTEKEQEGAPDTLYLSHVVNDAGEPLPEDFPQQIGTYRIAAEQIDSEQRLRLTPLGGDGALGYLVPEASVGGTFLLHRFP